MFAEPLERGLEEDWTIAQTMTLPNGDPAPLTGATVTLEISVIGGAVIYTTTNFQVTDADAGEGYWHITKAMRDADAESPFRRRVYAYVVRTQLGTGEVNDQNAGHLTVT